MSRNKSYSPNDKFYNPKDAAIVKVYKIDSPLRELVDKWVELIDSNNISVVDFELACKAALHFTSKKANLEEWKRLKSMLK